MILPAILSAFIIYQIIRRIPANGDIILNSVLISLAGQLVSFVFLVVTKEVQHYYNLTNWLIAGLVPLVEEIVRISSMLRAQKILNKAYNSHNLITDREIISAPLNVGLALGVVEFVFKILYAKFDILRIYDLKFSFHLVLFLVCAFLFQFWMNMLLFIVLKMRKSLAIFLFGFSIHSTYNLLIFLLNQIMFSRGIFEAPLVTGIPAVIFWAYISLVGLKKCQKQSEVAV